MIRYWADRVRERTGDAFVKGLPRDVDYVLDDMLGVGDFIWPSVRTDLHNTFDYPINEVIKIDGVGSGKSTFASLAVIYSLQVLALMPDPARVFGLMPGSKIGIVIMSLREAQAKSIIFDEIKQRLNDCAWFKKNYRHKEEGSRLIRFPNRVFILSGSSSETVPAGFNVLIGIMDECVVGETCVLTECGIRSISSIGKEKVRSVNSVVKPVRLVNHGVRETISIKLYNGIRLSAHSSHKIRTGKRLETSVWKPLSALNVKDEVLIDGSRVKFELDTVIDFSMTPAQLRGCHRRMGLPADMDSDLAWLLGYHEGDGSASRNKYNGCWTSYVKFMGQKDEMELEVVPRFKNVFGFAPELSNEGKVWWFVVYSAELYFFFIYLKQVFLEKYGAFYRIYLAGFFQADGCVDGKHCKIEQRVSKEKEMYQAFMMLLSLGWRPRLGTSVHDSKSYWCLKFKPTERLRCLKQNVVWSFKDEFYISGVKSIVAGRKEEVFDLVLKEDHHSYITNFVVSHNSDWFVKQSHIGDSLDQAENVYMSMKERVETRFGEKGLMILVSSARNPEGFMLKRYDEVGAEPDIYRTRRPQWEAKPGRWAPFFKVDLKSAKIVEEELQEYQEQTDEFILVPHSYKRAFKRNPRKFLRDRGSIVLINAIAYVLRPDAILINMNRRNPMEEDGTISEWFKPIVGVTYYSHNDLGETRDKLVLCIGHQEGYKTVIDLIYVIDPKEEGKADFERARQVFFELQRRGFQFGDEVTYDSWQSRDTIQRLEARGIPAAIMSVDKDKSAYDMWLEAHYDDAIDVPYVDGYMDCVKSLIDKGNKVDHTKQGQKDITDAVAGTVKHCRMAGMNMATVMVAKREKAIAPIARAQIRVKFMPESDLRDQSLREAALKF